MKKILTPLTMIIAIVAIVISCKPKDDPEPDVDTSTTVEQDKANIKAAFDQIVSCAVTFKNGDLVSTIQSMFSIDQGDGDNTYFDLRLDSLAEVFDFDHINDNSTFDFSHHTGTYTYNHSSGGWDKLGTPTNKVIAQFPSDSTKTTNDMEITITAYTTESHMIDGVYENLPKTGSYEIKKDGQVIHSITINTVAYEDLTNNTIPTDVDITIVTAPFTINITGRKIDALNFEGEIDVNNGSGCAFNLKGDIEFSSSDYENITDDDLVEANGTLSVNGVSVTTKVDLATLMGLVDPTENQYNSLIDNDLYFSGVKIADLEVRNVSDSTDTELHIIYKDATSEDADQAYYTPFVNDLETALFDLIGNFE